MKEAAMKIIDAHVHIFDAEGKQEPLYELAKRLKYDKLALMSVACIDPVQNILCALCKRRHPGCTYAFGGLDYVTGRDFKKQAENLYAMGFDGVKMLEGKPTTRRNLSLALDDPVYDGFYSFLEEHDFPVVMHVADPATFWDKARVPSWALENGWFYGENDAPYEQYYVEVESLLKKHPRLRAIFAHFFFLSWDMARAQKFLDNHPSVSFDITAGIEMYEDFSKDPERWRGFFIKNQDRIVFGTDSTDEPPAEGEKVALNGYAGMEIEFMTQSKEIKIYDMTLHCFGLPEEVCRKIFAENFIKLAGGEPKEMNFDLIQKEAALLRSRLKDEAVLARLEQCLSSMG
jgi:predicted TIM-barrel fold metal-dependent hydrolase